MQRPDGNVKRATELIFRKGDFVEVLVFADIVVYPKDGVHAVDIQYAPQEIVRTNCKLQLISQLLPLPVVAR
ncbi:hypothetical protein FOMPIDRAFT_1055924 [Fomitopsis schrenkii]|uniref:Uncharacterized protein n=1 Tax=Fomitopsis schrenkii TaxID=2126942 RepID=S8EV06_FOMSC|nr:hypothetical protein FOMPIDRAFT_1055924 [Fomitopsis schrenkii]